MIGLRIRVSPRIFDKIGQWYDKGMKTAPWKVIFKQEKRRRKTRDTIFLRSCTMYLLEKWIYSGSIQLSEHTERTNEIMSTKVPRSWAAEFPCLTMKTGVTEHLCGHKLLYIQYNKARNLETPSTLCNRIHNGTLAKYRIQNQWETIAKFGYTASHHG